MLPLKQILCPIDFSEPSLTAMDAACDLARHFNADLRVLNVVTPTSLPTDMVVIAATGIGPTDCEVRVEALQKVNRIIVERVPSDVKAQGK
jgi:nucleotide-binding universal stress UspA family protein